MKNGIFSSLHPNCNHQIVFEKFDLSILFPSLCEKPVWYCEKADAELIRLAIDKFDWLRAFHANINVNKKVSFFTRPLFKGTL